MALSLRGRVAVVLVGLACAGVLAYLRDPAWLIDQSEGLRPWETPAQGKPFRWSGGHASFFIPSDARTIRIPVATTFIAPENTPMMVTVLVDDARVERVLLTDRQWRELLVPMPPRGSRRVRRVDILTSVTRDDNHGVMIGEVQLVR